jgi:hypothetical protein
LECASSAETRKISAIASPLSLFGGTVRYVGRPHTRWTPNLSDAWNGIVVHADDRKFLFPPCEGEGKLSRRPLRIRGRIDLPDTA